MASTTHRTNLGNSHSTLSLTTATNNKRDRYRDWFRPKRWLSKKGTLSSTALHPLDREEVSWELNDREHSKKELEDLAAATWNQDTRIALLGLSEIVLSKGSSDKSLCNVERVVLGHEHTAEYLQQEKYRLHVLQKSKNKLYALKRIPTTKNGSARIKKRHLKTLIQEANILVKLGDHPNIPSLRGLPAKSCPENDFFLLMDRLHADTLDTRLRQWQMAGKSFETSNWDPYLEYLGDDDDTTATPNDDLIPRKTNYALQIAQALKACHDAGIVVRDLSPETIGFSLQDPHRIQLLELGHAMDTNSLQVPTKMVGKRRYQAGEIWKTGQYSFKTDVYSWSMIFYELIMERKPFHSYSAQDHENYVWEKGDRPLVASYSLPDGMKPLMEEAWAHDPDQRLTIDDVVHKAQTILMNLDSCLFWVADEDDFLFDLYLDIDSDAISELGDSWGGSEPMLAEVVPMLDVDVQVAIPEVSSEDGSTSHKSVSTEDGFVAQQRKMVSSAA